MISSYQELLEICLTAFLILLVLLFIFRKHVLSFFDPLFIYLITQAFTIELAFLQILEFSNLLNFILCQVSFSAAFLIMAGKPLNKRKNVSSNLLDASSSAISDIKLFALFSFIVIVLANLYLIKVKGVPLLADDPTAAKTEIYTQGQGLGLIRRMNWGLLYITALFLIYLYLYKNSFKYIFSCVFLLIILILSGSKSVLVYFFTLIPLLANFNDVKKASSFKIINYSKYLMVAGAVGLSLGIIVLATKGSLEQALFGLGTRFLYFGDVMLYYYDYYSVKHFSSRGFLDFINEDFSFILGFFRLGEYKKALGIELVDYRFQISGGLLFGPNVPYYVKGHIFFGAVGGIIYSFIVGGIVGSVRSMYYKLFDTSKGVIAKLLTIHINLIIFAYPQDSNTFFGFLFDTFTLSLPFYLFVFFFFRKINYKDLEFSKL